MTGLARLFPRSRRFGRYNLTYVDPLQETQVDSLVGAVVERHPYDVPNVTALPIVAGNPDYLDWIRRETVDP